MIQNYSDFVNALHTAGFSIGGGNSEGIYSVISWGWDEKPPYETPIKWHTGDAETDPWEWRMRVLNERNDIAYAKVFFRKSGYITKEWYPYFFAVRRGAKSFEDEYANGIISNNAKRIYETVLEHNVLPMHEIRRISGFTKGNSKGFDSALVELQMKLYLTMCGGQRKISASGEEYGWTSTVLCTVENFWGSEVIERAVSLSEQEAVERITERVMHLNPSAEKKKINKFIRG